MRAGDFGGDVAGRARALLVGPRSAAEEGLEQVGRASSGDRRSPPLATASSNCVVRSCAADRDRLVRARRGSRRCRAGSRPAGRSARGRSRPVPSSAMLGRRSARSDGQPRISSITCSQHRRQRRLRRRARSVMPPPSGRARSRAHCRSVRTPARCCRRIRPRNAAPCRSAARVAAACGRRHAIAASGLRRSWPSTAMNCSRSSRFALASFALGSPRRASTSSRS